MTDYRLEYFAVLLGLLLVCIGPLGRHLARVVEGERTFLTGPLGWMERAVYRVTGIDPTHEMDWRQYARSAVVLAFCGVVVLYLIQRLQGLQPLTGPAPGAVRPDTALNAAVSFVTSANWQSYAGETTMTTMTQMVGLTVQQVVSGATGFAVLAAFARGLRGREVATIGNFWRDLTRLIVFVFLPLCLVMSVVLVSQGTVQTLGDPVSVSSIQDGQVSAIPTGPVASQVATKILASNGGGFFQANSAHPFENPTPLTNFLQIFGILLFPAAATQMFGRLVGDRRQGWAIFAAMLVMFGALVSVAVWAEVNGTPALAQASGAAPGGVVPNLEGKEIRFGPVSSAVFASVTTATSNGSVNAMHGSFTPMGGFAVMLLMQLGEVVFGGGGTGLNAMLVFAIITVFVAGLMVGRTPEFLGKKIEAYEMKMAAVVLILPCSLVLLGTACAIAFGTGQSSMLNPGPHGYSELLYAYSSMANNNGSAFGGFYANTPYHNLVGAVAIWMGRFAAIVGVLALAGAFGRKRHVLQGPGTLRTHTPLFICMLVVVVVIVGALTYIPAIALGPVVEQLRMTGGVE